MPSVGDRPCAPLVCTKDLREPRIHSSPHNAHVPPVLRCHLDWIWWPAASIEPVWGLRQSTAPPQAGGVGEMAPRTVQTSCFDAMQDPETTQSEAHNQCEGICHATIMKNLHESEIPLTESIVRVSMWNISSNGQWSDMFSFFERAAILVTIWPNLNFVGE